MLIQNSVKTHNKLFCETQEIRIMFIPPRIVITKKCPRCQLRYRRKENQCTHCKELTDYEVEKLKESYDDEHKGNAQLGRWFLFASVIIVIFLTV